MRVYRYQPGEQACGNANASVIHGFSQTSIGGSQLTRENTSRAIVGIHSPADHYTLSEINARELSKGKPGVLARLDLADAGFARIRVISKILG